MQHEGTNEPGQDEGIAPPSKNLAKLTQRCASSEGELLSSATLKRLASLHAELREGWEALQQGAQSTEPESSGKVELPDWLANQRVVRTGPASGVALVEALNEGHSMYLADVFETAPGDLSQAMRIHLQLNEAVAGSLAVRHRETGRLVSLTHFERTAFILGLQELDSTLPGLEFHGKPAVAALVDLTLFVQLNAQALLRAGVGTAVLARGIRNTAEAAWFCSALDTIEGKLGRQSDPVRVLWNVDSLEGAGNADGIIAAFGSRLGGVRVDATGLYMNAGQSSVTIEDAQNGTGRCAEVAASVCEKAHHAGVPCTWTSKRPESTTHLLQSASLDGFAAHSEEAVYSLQQKVGEVFDGPNQLSSMPGKKPKSEVSGSTWSPKVEEMVQDLAAGYASSDSGVSRAYDMEVAELVNRSKTGAMDADSLRSALKSLRQSDENREVGMLLSKAVRKLLKDDTSSNRLSTVVQDLQAS